MLYTVRPLERIYFDMNKASDSNQESYQTFDTAYGHVYTRQVGNEYIVERISSTDMSDYLDERYQPGATFRAF